MVQPHGKEGPFSPGGPDPAWGGRSRGSPGPRGRRRSERRQPAPRPGRRAAEPLRGHSSTTESSRRRRRRLALPAPPGEEGRQLGGPPEGVFSLGPRKVSRKRWEAAGFGEAKLERGGRAAAALGLCKLQTCRLLPHQSGGSIHGSERVKGGVPESGHNTAPPALPAKPTPTSSHHPRPSHTALAWRGDVCAERAEGGESSDGPSLVNLSRRATGFEGDREPLATAPCAPRKEALGASEPLDRRSPACVLADWRRKESEVGKAGGRLGRGTLSPPSW